MDEVKKQRGGKREGAGRKPNPIKREKFIIYVSDAEQSAIKNIVEQMRNEISTQQSIVIDEQLELNLVNNNQIELDTLQSKYEDEISTLKSNHKNKISAFQSDIDFYINECSVLKSNYNELITYKSKLENEICILKSNSLKQTNIVNNNKVISGIDIDELFKLHQQGLTYNQVAEQLNGKGSTTATGRAWTKKSVEHQIAKIKKGGVAN